MEGYTAPDYADYSDVPVYAASDAVATYEVCKMCRMNLYTHVLMYSYTYVLMHLITHVLMFSCTHVLT